ncbi:MAG: hypothetical protein GXP05_11185 [Alphaproteobacteria bacterium]|nr:hypothetical protein [Alphaproteobacteria bacterium]
MPRPNPRRNALHPDKMSPDARVAEIGRILAAGLIRMRSPKSSALSANAGDSSLDLPVRTSGHAGDEKPIWRP